MKIAPLHQQFQSLVSLFQRTQTASGGDLEIQSHWAKYLCVLCAGFLENALREVYKKFVNDTSPAPVARFATVILEKIQNPKSNRFIEVASSFKEAWGADLTAYLEKDNRKEAIDSIMANRHQIAHGRPSGVTVAQIQTWLNKSKDVVEFMERQCKT